MTWRPIPGFERYEVSEGGEIRNAVGRILSPGRGRYGHLRVALRADAGRRMMPVHRAVLIAFVGPPPAGLIACHNNGDPADNRLTNLRWDTPSSNMHDAVKHGTHAMVNRTHCPYGHPYDEANTYRAKPSGGQSAKRFCRTCIRAQRARREARRLAAAEVTTCPVCGVEMPAITRRGRRQVCSKTCSGAFTAMRT